MKVAYLLSASALSGGNLVIVAQARELARRGHDVTVVCPEAPAGWMRLGSARYEEAPFSSSAALRGADAAVATFWTTVAPAVAHARGRVYHLCQGIEADFEFYAEAREEILAAYRLSTVKLVVAPHLAERLAELGLPGARVVGQAFDAAPFRVEGRTFSRRPPRVLLPGMEIGEIKGVTEALQAMARLREEGVDFTLVRFATEPPTARERRLGVTSEYHERLAPELVPRLYAESDLFLGPSHAEEGFDLPVLEALASGLPCALSDTPAHRHTAGAAALYFPAGDAAAIAGAVRRLAGDPGERRRLSLASPARAETFRTEDVGEKLEEALAQAGAHA